MLRDIGSVLQGGKKGQIRGNPMVLRLRFHRSAVSCAGHYVADKGEKVKRPEFGIEGKKDWELCIPRVKLSAVQKGDP